jgi:hypothetical protein
MEDEVGIEPIFQGRDECGRPDGNCACRKARAFLRDGCDTSGFAAGTNHAADHATMPAIAAAARRKVCSSFRGEEWRNQQPADQDQQRPCNRTPHLSTAIVVCVTSLNMKIVAKRGDWRHVHSMVRKRI